MAGKVGMEGLEWHWLPGVRGNGFGNAFVNRLLNKHPLSSPAAAASTIDKRFASPSEARFAKPDTMAERTLHRAVRKADEDFADEWGGQNAQAEAVEEAMLRASPLTASRLRPRLDAETGEKRFGNRWRRS